MDKKILVFTSAVSTTYVKKWLSCDLIDFAVVFYGQSDQLYSEFRKLPLKFLARKPGTKIDNFLYLLSLHPQILDYDYVIFMDEDISIEGIHIKRFSQIVDSIGSDLAQPAHTWASKVFEYSFLFKKPFVKYEIASFVEIQFFIISKKLLRDTIGDWKNFSTGFGLDHYLCQRLKQLGGLIAVVHEVTFYHAHKPVEERISSITEDFDERRRKIHKFINEKFRDLDEDFRKIKYRDNLLYRTRGVMPKWYNKLWFFFRIPKIIRRFNKYYLAVQIEHANVQGGVLATFKNILRIFYRRIRQVESIDEHLPSMSFAAIRFLNNYIRGKRNLKVFEFGSGGSTNFFLRKRCDLVSVESSEVQYENLKKTRLVVKAVQHKLTYVPDVYNEGVIDNSQIDNKKTSKKYNTSLSYAEHIDEYPEKCFDIILIYGADRLNCLRKSVSKVKEGGLIIFPKSDSAKYHLMHDIVPDSWRKSVIRGVDPWDNTNIICETTFFIRSVES